MNKENKNQQVKDFRLPQAEIFTRASTIARRQGDMPKSPCDSTASGTIRLCAAACLAHAGLQAYATEEEAGQFVRELATSHSFTLVRQVFDRLGWDMRLCEYALAVNDACGETDRAARVIWLFGCFARMAARKSK